MDDSRGNLAFLAWVDVIERIDTLLLEIRHIQANIIYVLRCPRLYDVLQEEENKLWPPPPRDSENPSSLPDSENEGEGNNCWSDVLRLSIDSALKESCHWVKAYPTLEEQLVLHGNIIWNADQKRHYHKLRSLQLLKSNLLHDKVHLCWWAVRLFDIENLSKVIPSGDRRKKEASKYAHFMLFRSAVLAKIRENVRWLGDLQDQFENDQDLGRQDHPRPSFARRREQGIYTTFLAERARDIASDLHSLVGRFLGDSSDQNSLTMHRWIHNYSSEGSVCQNDFRVAMRHNKTDSTDAEDHLDRINFINTSYWMPERPDLQSVIAHESAHQVIHERLFQFRDVWNEGNDAFSRLARELVYAMELFSGDDGKGQTYQRHRPTITVIEISSDLLATAVKGHAYVYALFLEIFGHGMEVMFDAPVDRYELAMADHLNCYSGVLANDREWYYRLRIVCAWITAIHHIDKPSRIDKMLVDGIEALLEDSLDYISGLDVTHPESKAYWKTLTDRLCDIVRKSEAAAQTKKWRKDRSDDCPNGGRHSVYYKKHSRPIPSELRNYIFRYFRIKKGDLHDGSFDKVYLGRTFTSEGGKDIGDRPLFQHLYDVPWQSSMLKAIDFTELLGKNDLNKWMWNIHYDLALGREAYQMAIEFELWTTKTASIRARKVCKLIDEVGLSTTFNGLLDSSSASGFTSYARNWCTE
ncbi:hypothetical protein [Thiolapillus brandeum]|uniref:Uncharacterized protein n=1 Tax=Thiolapillus brandeum TaxID=1076588 RepID=A0A7U6GGI6_9GAMM|nr:hypothetical protein [Thiolapillus brandeum]BAO43183.1 hypothetical protein TBH_C0237 [Thiolapillus brandeum]